MLDWVQQPSDTPPGRIEPIVVIDDILEKLKAEGYRIVERDGRVSMNEPITKTLILADWSERTLYARALLLVHEWTHVRQFRGGFWRRLMKGLVYLLSRSVRVAVEVEAKAQAAYADYRLMDTLGRDRVLALRVAAVRATAPDRLAGLVKWRIPYLTLADPEDLSARIRTRLRELSAE